MSDLPKASESDNVEGQSFYAPALVGSGTILADGTYAAPMPDPNVLDPEAGIFVPDEAPRTGRIRAGKVHEATPAPAGSDTAKTTTPAKKTTPAKNNG